MKTSTQFAKKLSAYSILAGAFISAKQADAQIVYTDIIPDDSLVAPWFAKYDSSYYLDLNNDGQLDFKFRFEHDTSNDLYFWSDDWELRVTQYNGNEILGTDAFTGIYALDSNDPIGPISPWVQNASPILAIHRKWEDTIDGTYFGHTYLGFWLNEPNNFVGLRLISNSDTLYGWVRMDVSITSHVIIKDYAVDTIPGEAVSAGSSFPLIISDPANSNFQIFPNPISSHFYFTYLLTHPSTLTITNTIGIIAKQLTLAPNSGSTIIPVDDLRAGVYLVTLLDGEKRVSKKLVIAR